MKNHISHVKINIRRATTLVALLLTASTTGNCLQGSDDVPAGYHLLGMGLNSTGQLGDGTTNSSTTPVLIADDVVTMSAGQQHTLYVTADGTLFAMGLNQNGALGDGTTTNSSVPIQIATGVATVSGGYLHSMYVTTDGKLYGMGDGGSGQLGNGMSSDQYSPVLIATGVKTVSAGGSHTLYQRTDKQLYGMGNNEHGQLGVDLGLDTDNAKRTWVSEPVQIALEVIAISAGLQHSLYVTSDGKAYGMGANEYGQIGDGTTTDVTTPLYVASSTKTVSAGYYFSLNLGTNSGTLSGYGYNLLGQLGNGTTVNQLYMNVFDSDVTTISAGGHQTLYLKSDGTLYGTGYNADGELGIGSTDNVLTPVKIALDVVAVDAGGTFSLFLTNRISPYEPTDERGAKWCDMGWIDDTYYPWVYDYDLNNWYYVYSVLAADVDEGYWIAYYTSDFDDYGWGYVYPTTGWWCFTSNMQPYWLDFGDPLPQIW